MKSIRKILVLFLVNLLFITNFSLNIYADQMQSVSSINHLSQEKKQEVVINLTYVTSDGAVVKRDTKKFSSPFVQHFMHDLRPVYIPEDDIEIGVYNFPFGVHEVIVPVKFIPYTLTVIPKDEFGTEIAGYKFEVNGTYGEEAVIPLPEIPHFNTEVPNFVHTFTDDETYSPTYTSNIYTIKLLAVDDTNNDIINVMETTAKYKEFISFTLPEIDGYFHYGDSREHFVFGDAELKVPYFRDDISITVDYELEDGTVVDSQSIQKLYKDDYSIILKEFPEYIISSIDTNGLGLSGTMPSSDQTFKVKLERRPITNVINFYDDLGNLVFSKRIYGSYGDSVTIKLPPLPGYITQTISEEITLQENDKVVTSSSIIQRSSNTIKLRYITSSGTTIFSKNFNFKYLDSYSIKLMDIPGYTFDERFENNSIDGIMPAYDVSIPITITQTKPLMHTLLFETNNGSYIPPQYINYQEYAMLPATPSKDLYNFGGWYLDPNFQSPWNVEEPVLNDLIIYAKWIPVDKDMPKVDEEILPNTGISNYTSFSTYLLCLGILILLVNKLKKVL